MIINTFISEFKHEKPKGCNKGSTFNSEGIKQYYNCGSNLNILNCLHSLHIILKLNINNNKNKAINKNRRKWSHRPFWQNLMGKYQIGGKEAVNTKVQFL